jgi:hypothetical protein
MKTAVFIAASITFLSAYSAAQASTCIGNCGTLGANGDVTAPPIGSTYGYVSSFQGVTGAGEITGVGGTNGSEFTTSSFSSNAGASLNFYFNYITGDGTSEFPDYGFAELETSTGNHVAYLFTARTVAGSGDTSPGFGLPTNDSTLNPANTPINPGATHWDPLGSSSGGCYGGPGNGCGNTGWIQSTYTIGSAGDYELRFGVTNFGDTAVDSGLAFAGVTVGGVPVSVGGVPEPATWAMFLFGFGAMGWTLRFARSRQSANGQGILK